MPHALDLFCGAAGGWSVGLHRAGIVTAAACEIDPWRRAVFAANFPDARMYEDVRELTATRLLADLGALPAVVVGSPPCQDISSANTKGSGIDGARSGLFWEAVRLILEVRPVWACLENSPRLRTLGYDELADELEAAGYACWPLVVGARHAGACHRRDRVWLVAADASRISNGARIDQTGRQGRTRFKSDDPDAARIGGVGWQQQERRSSARDSIRVADVAPITADADRVQLWQQPGRNCGADGRGAAVAGEHDSHANGQGQHGLAHNGEMGGGMVEHPAHADGARHPLRPRFGSDDGAELPPALGAIGRAWPDWNGGLSGLSAACAAAGAGHVDDECFPGLAPGLRNRAIAALGDAVVPQIAEAIGRTMMGMIAS